MDDIGVTNTLDGNHVMLWERHGATVYFNILPKEEG